MTAIIPVTVSLIPFGACNGHRGGKYWLMIRNSYTMGCPPVRGDNPRALASGLSYVQVDNPWYNFFYITYISVDLAHQVIFRAKVGKGGIKTGTWRLWL